MFCQKCGKENPDDTKFCGGCGAAIGENSNSQPAPLQQPAAKPKKKNGCLVAILAVVGVIVLFAIIGNLAGKGGTSKNVSQPDKQAATTSKDKTESTAKVEAKPDSQPKIEFSNVMLQSSTGITYVFGEAKNNDSNLHSFTLKVSFYDKDKKLLGTAVGAVNGLNGGSTKIFSAMASGDYSAADSYKVQVDTMVQSKENVEVPIEFSNVIYKDQSGLVMVEGEAKNKDSKAHSFTIMVGLYDENKKLIGITNGAVNDLAGGDTKTFTTMGAGKMSKPASCVAQVDTIIN